MVPFTQTVRATVPASATAVTTLTPVGDAPFAGTVTAVRYFAAAAITGANTNTRRIDLHNRGAAGTGTTVAASKQFDSAVNAVADTDTAITLSGTPANLVLAAGDALAVNSVAVGTGLADPGGVIEVDIARSTTAL
jgi:hypothetical protein